MEHVEKRFFLSLDAVDIDGCDATGDMVAADGKQDIFHEEVLFGLGDGTYFPSRRVFAPQGRSNDSHALQQTRSRAQEIFFFCVSADEYGRGQLLFLQDDDHVVRRSRDDIGGRLIGNVEEFQRITRNVHLKASVDG